MTASVIGTWSLVEAWDADDPADPSRRTHPWGDPPAGYWVFDHSGHFSLMISRNPPLPRSTGSLLVDAVREFVVETFVTARPYAYFGTYTVEPGADADRGTLLLAVTSDVLRAYTGTVQRRKFVFDGPDHLNVGEPGAYLRRLRRLT